MTKTLYFAVFLGSLAVFAANGATVTWDGGSGNWLGDANWTVGGTPGQVIPDQTSNDDDVFVNSGTVAYVPGADFGLNWGASTVTVSGGTVSQSTTNWWRFNGTGSLTVSGGTINTGATNVQFGESAGDSASLLLTLGLFNHTGSGEFKVRGGNTATITGGKLSTRFLSIGDFGAATIDVSGGELELRDGSIGFNGIFNSNGGHVNLTGSGVFHVGNIDVAAAAAAYLDTNKVRAGGNTDSSLLQVVSDGLGGVNITAIPEPSSLFLLALGSLGLMRRRAR